MDNLITTIYFSGCDGCCDVCPLGPFKLNGVVLDGGSFNAGPIPETILVAFDTEWNSCSYVGLFNLTSTSSGESYPFSVTLAQNGSDLTWALQIILVGDHVYGAEGGTTYKDPTGSYPDRDIGTFIRWRDMAISL